MTHYAHYAEKGDGEGVWGVVGDGVGWGGLVIAYLPEVSIKGALQR